MSVNNKAIVEKVNVAFAVGSTEGFLAFCAEDVAWTVAGDTTVQGKDGAVVPYAYCDIDHFRGDQIVA